MFFLAGSFLVYSNPLSSFCGGHSWLSSIGRTASLSLDYCLAPCMLAIAHLWQLSLHSVILSLAVWVNVLVSLDYCLARLATALLSAVEYPADGNVWTGPVYYIVSFSVILFYLCMSVTRHSVELSCPCCWWKCFDILVSNRWINCWRLRRINLHLPITCPWLVSAFAFVPLSDIWFPKAVSRACIISRLCY